VPTIPMSYIDLNDRKKLQRRKKQNFGWGTLTPKFGDQAP